MSPLRTYGPPLSGLVEEAKETFYCAREAHDGMEASLAAAIQTLRNVPTDGAKKLADRLDDFLSEKARLPRITEDEWEQAIAEAREEAA